jgi:hypothetical protein
MPEDQGMIDTLGNAIRLARHVLSTTHGLSPEGDSVLHCNGVPMNFFESCTRFLGRK